MLLQPVIHVRLLKNLVEMNIIFTGGFTYPQGMAGTKRVSHFINYLKSKGLVIKVAILNNTIDNIREFSYRETINGVSYRAFQNSSWNILIRILIFPYTLYSFCMYLLKNKLTMEKNILYVYNEINIENILILLFAKRIGYLIVHDIVEDFSLSEEKISLKLRIKFLTNKYFEKRIIKFSHGLIVISSVLANKFKILTKNSIPIVLLPVAADKNKFPRMTALNKNDIVIGYSGSFGKKDGLDSLIKAFEIVNMRYSNTILLLTGSGNNPFDYLRKTQNMYIKYIGYLADKQYYSFLKSADILCMTRINSKYANAGFPFKLGEYLSTGNPVIVTDVSDVSSYLINGVDAIIVRPDAINEIAEAMCFLIENRSKAIEIGNNGLKKWEKFFNSEVVGENLFQWMLSI